MAPRGRREAAQPNRNPVPALGRCASEKLARNELGQGLQGVGLIKARLAKEEQGPRLAAQRVRHKWCATLS
eukprot:CAMPEP_0180510790 /NCGR_PEP_ID=MMETSP1036_2-20121128/50605_1 /TAXON_ID=632150 /ORGANISM="Azadinium spinosum, Strain 3D9" /LENGTH=70 /DNA_ID=CAMNT_0022521611 /DNA_START=122 /DNA_END=331 /DNA_ORIENTATION=-